MADLVTRDTELSKALVFDPLTKALRREDGNATLPGQARVSLCDEQQMDDYLQEAISVDQLDRISPYFKYSSTPSHTHISPVHHQAVRGRKILVAENPQLHLVWYYDRIFIKPIPLYLLSAAFWEYLVAMDNQKIHRACAGFLRTYAFLIRYETDFLQAQSSDVRLIPPKLDGSAFTYEEFATFIAPFASLGDSQVSPRFSYGELRLTRLNWLTRMFLGKLTYHHIDAQKNAYIGRIVTPFIGAFAIMTVILSAMQVELQAQSLNTDVPSQGFLVFAQVSKWFSVLVVIIVTFLVAVLIIFILFLCVHDQLFFRKVLRMKRSGRLQPPRVMTGVV